MFTKSSRTAATKVGLAGFGFFMLAVVISGALTPGYSHVRENMSALASLQAPHPWIVMAGIVGLGVTAFATAIALRGHLSGRASKVATTLMMVAGAGLLVAGLAREDCSTALDACRALEQSGAVSSHHMLHELVSGLSFVMVVGANLLLARGLRRTPRLAWLATRGRLVGPATLVLLVVFVSGIAGPIGGLVQRAFLALALGWPLAVAFVATPSVASEDQGRLAVSRVIAP